MKRLYSLVLNGIIESFSSLLVVPVASAIMTPLPLTIALIILKLRAWKAKSMETEKKAPSTILVAHDSITPLTYVEA